MTRETAIALLESAQNMYASLVLAQHEYPDVNVLWLLDKARLDILKAETELLSAEPQHSTEDAGGE